MKSLIIRNDDVAVDCDVKLLREFSKLCDRFGHRIIQAITPVGKVIDIECAWSNDRILSYAGAEYYYWNQDLYDFMLIRNDLIAAHGLWHTHAPHSTELLLAKQILQNDFNVPYYVCPFNEGTYPETVHGMKVLNKNCDRLETYFDNGTLPTTDIVYVHSWRFANKPYNLKQLENFFEIWKNTH